MSEQLRDISIRVEIDTNKQTYRVTTDNMKSLIEWWNAHSDLGLAEYELIEDRARSGGNEGSDTPDDRALHRLAALLASCDDHGWSSNGVFSATLPTRSAAREIAEIVDALVDSALTPIPDCTSRNPSPPGMTLT